MRTTCVKEARELLKQAKKYIKDTYGWGTKEYRATVHESKSGLRLNVKLLKPIKGFKIICDCLQKTVNIQNCHFDATHRDILDQVKESIQEEFDKGIYEGTINGMDWRIGIINEKYFPVQNAAGSFATNLYNA
ncbi:hypothetical protein ACI2JA_03920 [Alkalihalobacillus sp. NPDC078783]